MPRYLLDTNVVSDLIRNPTGLVGSRLSGVDAASICTSIIVAAELRFGATKKKSARLAAQVETALKLIPVIALQSPIDIVYGTIRAELETRGELIGSNDLFIAAQAVALECVLVTSNVREFSRVRGLAIENWLR